MTLSEFIAAQDWSMADAAKAFGLDHPRTVHRYASGERIPRPEVMRRIVHATGGKVTPGDFYHAPAAD
ncbi:helix-turn-helix domain-containing protein [Roseococcus pinisoli]|nr:helix-turn-helix domain-containing protein [Roseococcus pinisoli]